MADFRERQIYVDTSVFGGFFDEEFSKASRMFFEQVEERRFLLMTSPLVVDEISRAPAQVRDLFERFGGLASLVDIDDRAMSLQAAYLNAGIVGPKHGDDALHVALATVGGANLIVSWNFKQIVHFEKIAYYNAVNALNGYGSIAIHSPSEVIIYEDENI